ncbi:hypothetical protein Tco_0746114 [Tanacetum coccineum]
MVEGDKPPKDKEKAFGSKENSIDYLLTPTTDPIPDVKGAFATLSIDESDRSTQSHNVSKSGNGNSAFVARTNNRNNNWFGSNNQTKKVNRPNLIYTHFNMNGHTTDRCFELIGYPPNFKKNIGINRGYASNNVVSRIKINMLVHLTHSPMISIKD